MSQKTRISTPKRRHEEKESDDESSSDSLDTSVATVIRNSNNKLMRLTSKDSLDENEEPMIQKCRTPKRRHESDDGSSSDSSVGDYLKTASQINLDSSFFSSVNASVSNDFESVENDILSGINRLTDSESDNDVKIEEKIVTCENVQEVKMNFSQLREYNEKINDAKICVDNYIKNKNKSKKSTDKPNIRKLLKLGETQNKFIENSECNSDSENESTQDWEEIVEESTTEDQINIPKNGVEICIQLPNAARKQNKEVDVMASIKRRLNRIQKENHLYVHKVHLLCWIAYGNYINYNLNNEELLSIALSLLPSEKCYPPKHADMKYLEQIVSWYKKLIKIKDENMKESILKDTLQIGMSKKQVTCKRDYVLIFIIILRSIGLQCRLILSFNGTPLRLPNNQLYSNNINQTNKKTKCSKTSNKTECKNYNVKKNTKGNKSKSDIKNKNSSSKSNSNRTKEITKKYITTPMDTELENNDKSILENCEIKNETSSSSKNGNTNESEKLPQVDGADDEFTSKPKRSWKQTIKLNFPKLNHLYFNDNNNDNTGSQKRNSEVATNSKKPENISSPSTSHKSSSRNDIKKIDKVSTSKVPSKSSMYFKKLGNIVKNDTKERKPHEKKLKLSHLEGTSNIKKINGNDSSVKGKKCAKNKSSEKRNDSDLIFKANTNVKRKTKSESEVDGRIISSDENELELSYLENEDEKKVGNDIWVEVFLEEEEKWICVDLFRGQIHCISEITKRASQPVSYILAWNNNFAIKDVSPRYCPNWNTVTRKLRVNSEWWKETLKPFLGTKTIRDKEEDEDLLKQQFDKPLPTIISEYKNHPLYALKRHLLKFESIYPEDALILGYVRKEAVYARECVHTLHSREVWVKHAKIVKPNQDPYKIVKARPKYDKLSGKMLNDMPLELFGPWQVEDYVPPTAENGVVPRNAFGNVELFKKCMLPKNTVHLQLPGLNKIARKLQIDCAPAVVGFDFHSGWSHPTFDGFVVCEEFKDILIGAWEQEQEETAKKECEKYEKRVWGNWRKIIKGLLIRERLKSRYDFGQEEYKLSKN